MAAYLYCAGTPDDCRDRALTPTSCASEETAYLDCVLGPVPGSCLRDPPKAGYDGCELATFCGADGNYWIGCDAEDDRTGTSLCGCYIDDAYSETYLVDGIGAQACAQATKLCGPP